MRFLNHYECNDRCPGCNHEIEPYESDELEDAE